MYRIFLFPVWFFCVGLMLIGGSMKSGLTGNHQTLFVKSVLDGIIAIVFSSSLDMGGLCLQCGRYDSSNLCTIKLIWLKKRKIYFNQFPDII